MLSFSVSMHFQKPRCLYAISWLLAGEFFERFTFENGVVIDVIKNFSIEHKKSAVDPIFQTRLFLKLDDGTARVINLDHTEIRLWMNRRQSRKFAMRRMKVDQRADIDVRQTVAIGHAKGFFVDVFFDQLYAATGICVETSVHEFDFAKLPVAEIELVIGANPDISRLKITFYVVAEMTETEYEIIQPIVARKFLADAKVSAARRSRSTPLASSHRAHRAACRDRHIE